MIRLHNPTCIVPGKLLVTGDALSRAPLSNTHCEVEPDQDPEHIMEVCVKHLPATQQRLSQYKQAQSVDPVCFSVMKYCREEWPDRHHVEPALKPYCSRGANHSYGSIAIWPAHCGT